MKYACGNEPMVGDVVNGLWVANYKNEVEACVIVIINDNIKVRDRDGCVRIWRIDHCTLVRRASAPLPFIDGSDVFHTEKPKHRYPRRWETDTPSRYLYIEQCGPKCEAVIVYRSGAREEYVCSIEWLERNRMELFDHHDENPEPSELDTLREKLRAAEAKLEAVREAVR